MTSGVAAVQRFGIVRFSPGFRGIFGEIPLQCLIRCIEATEMLYPISLTVFTIFQ